MLAMRAVRAVVGLISDTHGLMRPEAVAALRGVDRIVHAGDVGTPEVLAALRPIAPVTAVRGNNDRGAWAEDLPDPTRVSTEPGQAHLKAAATRLPGLIAVGRRAGPGR
jgi:uncharacterized protein